MFGKPEWFVPKKIGWGLTPVTWQGWVFTAVVAALIAVPFNLLLLTVGWPEALIWMAVGIVALCVEVYHILQAMQSPPKVDSDEDVLHITDDKPARNESLKTNRLDLKVADRD